MTGGGAALFPAAARGNKPSVARWSCFRPATLAECPPGGGRRRAQALRGAGAPAPGRRAAAAGIATRIGNHSFRATDITAYLNNGGTLERPPPWRITLTRAPYSFTIAVVSNNSKESPKL